MITGSVAVLPVYYSSTSALRFPDVPRGVDRIGDIDVGLFMLGLAASQDSSRTKAADLLMRATETKSCEIERPAPSNALPPMGRGKATPNTARHPPQQAGKVRWPGGFCLGIPAVRGECRQPCGLSWGLKCRLLARYLVLGSGRGRGRSWCCVGIGGGDVGIPQFRRASRLDNGLAVPVGSILLGVTSRICLREGSRRRKSPGHHQALVGIPPWRVDREYKTEFRGSWLYGRLDTPNTSLNTVQETQTLPS